MHKKTWVTVLLAGAVLALAFALNPSPDRHRAQIKDGIAQRSLLAGVLGVGAVTAFVSTYHSVGMASYTEVDGRLLTIGAFGTVFLLH